LRQARDWNSSISKKKPAKRGIKSGKERAGYLSAQKDKRARKTASMCTVPRAITSNEKEEPQKTFNPDETSYAE